jgi:D-glycero-D-manno-heptose 1,7-bisphosphate phosphatase
MSAGTPWLYPDSGRTYLFPAMTGSGPRAILFDRDGTLVEDDPPYNGDPAKVALRPGALAALRKARASGLAVGVVSNQSGVGRGLLTREQVEAVANRIEELLGRFDVWVVCPHLPDDGCPCRKPAPGMVVAAADRLGLSPTDVAVIGDIGADMEAAAAAGARGVLVPTPVTRPAEIAAAESVAPDLTSAVDLLLALPSGRVETVR